MNISYSNYRTWNEDRDAWVLRYLLKRRDKQTRPMAVGTAFDAYVKAYLESGTPSFRQIHDDYKTEMAAVGAKLLAEYQMIGAYDRILELIGDRPATTSDKLQFGHSPLGVPICGIPDLVTHRVVLDWKVNGAPPGRRQSPAPGYTRVYEHKPTNRRGKVPTRVGKDEWWEQLTFYKWMTDRDIGVIHQLVWNKDGMRCAEFQLKLDQAQVDGIDVALAKMYQQIQDDHIYDDLSRSESQERVAMMREVDWEEDA